MLCSFTLTQYCPRASAVDDDTLSEMLGAVRKLGLCYAFVCRTILGCFVQIQQPTKLSQKFEIVWPANAGKRMQAGLVLYPGSGYTQLGTADPVFAAGKRELVCIPGVRPAMHHHSEIAEIAPGRRTRTRTQKKAGTSIASESSSYSTPV